MSCPVSGLEGIKTVVFRYMGGSGSLMNVDGYRFLGETDTASTVRPDVLHLGNILGSKPFRYRVVF